jgi:hypothetical protein
LHISNVETFDGSVDAFERVLEPAKRLPRLELSPQSDRAPFKPALLRKPILFNHPFDAGEPAAWVGPVA